MDTASLLCICSENMLSSSTKRKSTDSVKNSISCARNARLKPNTRGKSRVIVKVTSSNQLWETDVKYGYIEGENRFFFLLSILDVGDRSIVDYYVGTKCEVGDAVALLQRALWKRNQFEGDHRPIIRTDNGP